MQKHHDDSKACLTAFVQDNTVDAYVIHATSVAISREHRRAKTDRIDTAMLRRGFLGWLRGERGHCSMAVIPTIAEEDAKRPHRERESLVKQRTRTPAWRRTRGADGKTSPPCRADDRR
jgi:transposase